MENYLAENYLAIEGEIIARLREEIPQFLDVMGAGESASLAASAIRTPCAIVMFDGELVGGDDRRAGDSSVQASGQRWVVFVGARSAAQEPGGSSIRDLAGPLISRAIFALAGWQPASASRPLVRITPRGLPDYRPGGLGFFPVAFEARVILRRPN